MPRRQVLPVGGDGTKLAEMIGAVIYVRVSTKEQTENLSLPTQLRTCEEYCRRQGYEVVERFHEEGESAKTTDRSQLQALLKYCRTHKGKVHFVVVYNLTRFAREKYDHFALRAHLQSLGISLRSATEPIDDTSTGKLMEGVLAAFAQFDNDVRSERTLAGMKAALSLGRWTFQAPLGYLNAPKWSTSSLVHDPERAPLVKQAFGDLASGQFTAQEVIRRATVAGLRTRRDRPLSAQTFGNMLRNRIYIGHIESPEIAVSARGDFAPLIDEATFYGAQAVLDGRVPVATARQRNHPDFPLRGFVRCETCGRPLTGSWSKGRNGRYAYYHCPRRCRAVNVSKAALEGAFVDELALLQPTPGCMRLVKDQVLCVWEQECAAAQDRAAEQERRLKAVRLKLDRLDEAFLYSESIDLDTYSRQRDKLREELTLSKIDYHTEAVEELDVEGILAFAERILPRAADLWVQASLDYRQRLQEPAVEALTDRGTVHGYTCPKCGKDTQHETPGPTQLFRDFLETYAPGGPLKKRRDSMYALRSGIFHGSTLMRLDLDRGLGWDPPWWDEQDLIRELWVVTRVALRNWLWSKTQP
jgi:DNA invertase Pin-like site-specific DNA recombinase